MLLNLVKQLIGTGRQNSGCRNCLNLIRLDRVDPGYAIGYPALSCGITNKFASLDYVYNLISWYAIRTRT